jgi:uncharacterized membrane protein YoaK (UPF0700 family)
MSESLAVGLILAFSGGLMDAYTYVFRGGVFANAQTGNIILMGIHALEGSFSESARYLTPILSFALGVLLAQGMRLGFPGRRRFHWRQACLAIEMAVMVLVGFMGQNLNLIANSLVSLACGIQVQSFQKVRGRAIATTMCIGNLRTATEHLANAVKGRDRALFGASGFYYGMILVFALGAVFGKWLVGPFGARAIWASAALLFVAFAIMFIEEKQERSGG